MISLPPVDRKHIYTKRSMYAGTHFTDPERLESENENNELLIEKLFSCILD